MPAYNEFEFDLPAALLTRLVDALNDLDPAPLGGPERLAVPEAQGVYQIYLNDTLVYIGKTDAEAGLHQRLGRHARKVLHRHNLQPDSVRFKALRIFVFTAIDLETQLIRHYAGKDGTAWNGSGFGSNDPGRKRDHSAPGRFDSAFPINIDLPIQLDLTHPRPASEVVALIKAALPYTFRYQCAGGRSRRPHPDLAETIVSLPGITWTVRQVLEALTQRLPPGWQSTALAPVVILYKEISDEYPAATIIARSPTA